MYQQLHQCRMIGMQASGIPPSEIKYILDFHQVDDPETRTEYYNIIRAIDSKWLELNDEANKQSKNKNKKGK